MFGTLLINEFSCQFFDALHFNQGCRNVLLVPFLSFSFFFLFESSPMLSWSIYEHGGLVVFWTGIATRLEGAYQMF